MLLFVSTDQIYAYAGADVLRIHITEFSTVIIETQLFASTILSLNDHFFSYFNEFDFF